MEISSTFYFLLLFIYSFIQKMDYASKQKDEKVKLTKQEKDLRNIFLNRRSFKQNPIDQTIFQSDLIIKFQFPQQKYSKRPKTMNIGTLVSKPTDKLLNAYTAAFKKLYKDMDRKQDAIQKSEIKKKISLKEKTDVELKLREAAAFKKSQKCHKKKGEQFFNEQQDIKFSSQSMIRDLDLQSFVFPSNKQIYKQTVNGQVSHVQIQYQCQEEYSGTLDAFIINLNAVIYVLQQHCKFRVRSYIFSDGKSLKGNLFNQINSEKISQSFDKNQKNISRQVFLFIYTPDDVLIRAANNFKIKKELFYNLIDPFLNQPTDKKQRQLKFHSEFQPAEILLQENELNKQKDNKRNSKTKNKSSAINEGLKNKDNIRKKQQRRLNFKTVSGKHAKQYIKSETCLGKMEKSQFQSFTAEFLKETKDIVGKQNQPNFNSKQEEGSLLCEKQIKYVKLINRGKYNKGVEKIFMQIKNQKGYIAKLTEISCMHKYKTYQYPRLFVQFQAPFKQKGFFDKLKHFLLYKPHVMSPSGDLALFNKMQRIKLSYLILTYYFSVKNFSKFKANLFAVNDNFQKFGIVGNNLNQFYQHCVDNSQDLNDHPLTCHTPYKEITGGIYGKPLSDSWKILQIWKNDFFSIRGYLGEKQAHQIYVKTKLLQLFFVLSLYGVGAEILKTNYVDVRVISRVNSFLVTLGYFGVVVVVYAVFMETFIQGQKLFLYNFDQSYQVEEFRENYKGPFIRNKLNDKANDYADIQFRLFDKLKTIFFLMIVIIVIGLQIGFYYLIRILAVYLAQIWEDYDRTNFYLVYPNYFVAYMIFFIGNKIIAKVFIQSLFVWMTNFENWPTQHKFQQAISTKIYLYLICTELIAPIDLIYVQYSTRNYCQSNWCNYDLAAYAYYRYFSILITVFLRLIRMVFNTIKNRRIKLANQQNTKANSKNTQANQKNTKTNPTNNIQELKAEQVFCRKLQNYLDFVYKQSKMDKPQRINLYEESLIILIFITFVTVFPLGLLVSFLLLLISYIIQRRQILVNYQRPISKSEKLEDYGNKLSIGLHWMLFFNFSQMVINLKWIQNTFQTFTLQAVPNPTFQTMMLARYCFILILLFIFEIVVVLFRLIVRQNLNFIESRKKYIYNQQVQVKNIFRKSQVINGRNSRPISSISRVFNQCDKKSIFMNQSLSSSSSSSSSEASVKNKIIK